MYKQTDESQKRNFKWIIHISKKTFNHSSNYANKKVNVIFPIELDNIFKRLHKMLLGIQ